VSEELKSCPFCGGKAQVYGSENESYYWVGCETGCDVNPQTAVHKTKSEAIKVWNKRVTEKNSE